MLDSAEKTLAPLRAEKQILAPVFMWVERTGPDFPRTCLDSAFPATVTRESHRFAKGSLMVTRPVLDPDNNSWGHLHPVQPGRHLQPAAARRGHCAGRNGRRLHRGLLISSRLQGIISKPILQLSQTARVVSEKP